MSNSIKPLSPLTEREREVLLFVCKGCTNAEIARYMNKSKHTVDDWMASILRRLDVATRVEAAVWAAKQGLV